ncbi:MAG: B12-binding domain-containing radical SAM protein [Spirochaetales bacterium]|nr:B12-binding domain-containing radical SAM protein [Spirochaetales bacterium]
MHTTPGKITILLLLPDARIHKLDFGLWRISFREAPLTLTTLAALIPGELDVKVTLVDESVMRIPRRGKYDIVGISCLTGTARRAYQLAKHFKENGSTVILGGIHVTLLPEEALQYADAIVVGFAEKTWPLLLRDYMHGKLRRVYKDTSNDVSALPLPERRLQKKGHYMVPNTVFATRGCKGSCSFCSVPAAKYGWHKRPVSEVVDEIRSISAKRFVFNDVHITQEPDYTREILKAITPLHKEWGGLASTRILDDPLLLDAMEESGCSYLLIGFESFNRDSLASIRKKNNKVDEYRELVRELHKRRITVQGCFIFGFDHDDKSVFKNTVDMVNELKIDIPRYAVFTPYPGTEAYRTFEKENRLLHREWYYYDTQHVVFLPKHMSPYELDEGFKWAYRETFRIPASISRTFIKGKSFVIPFLGNLAYKLYVHRLYTDANRFPDLNDLKRMKYGNNIRWGVV